MIINDHKKAIIHSDMTSCADCGKSWDTNDPEPPACEPVMCGRDRFVRVKAQINQPFKKDKTNAT